MKTCSKCGHQKPLEDFPKMSASKDGRHTQCKACKAIGTRDWYVRNQARALAYQQEYRRKNPEKNREWRAANPTYHRDRERRLAENPAYREARALRRAEHHLRTRQAVLAKLGGCCGRCGFNDPRALQIDHIAGGGNLELSTIPRTVYLRKVLAAGPGIYQLLCANCNWIKRWENDEHSCSVRDTALVEQPTGC